MNNFLPVVVFLLLLSFVGFLFLNLLWPKTLNTFEKIGASFGIGLIINFINCFFFSIISVKLTAVVIFSALLAWVVILLTTLMKRKKLLEFFAFKKEYRVNILTLMLVLGVSLILLLTVYRTLAAGFNSWDEFSFWGKASKAVHFTGSIFIQPAVTVGASSNPVFLPASAGSISIVSGYFFAENFAKLLSPLCLISLCIFLFGYFKRLKLTTNESLLFLLLLLTSSQKFLSLSSILYADITLVYYYTIGTLILLRLLFEKFDNRLIYYSLLFLAVVPFIKKGASVSALISLFSVFIVLLPELYKNKKIRFALFASIIIVISQLSASVLSKFAGEIASPFPARLFQYTKQTIPLFPHMLKLMFEKMTDVKIHTIIWPLTTVALFIGAWFSKNRVYFSLFIIALLNIGYVFVATISLFSLVEAKNMAAFERYVIQFLPIYFLSIAFLYIDFKEKMGA